MEASHSTKKTLLTQETTGSRRRRLATGLRGAHLYETTQADDKVFWSAECTVADKLVSKRFASELHARAWLSVATQSRVELSSVERRDFERPCSSPCFADKE